MAITITDTGMSPAAFTAALGAAAGLTGTTRQTLTISGGVLTVPLTAQWAHYRVQLSVNCTIVPSYPEGADTETSLFGADIEFVAPSIGGPFTATPPVGWAYPLNSESSIALNTESSPMIVSMSSWSDDAGIWSGAKLSTTPFTLPSVVDAAYLQSLIPTAIIFDSVDPADGYVFSDPDGLITTDPGTDRRVQRWRSYSSPTVYAVADTENTSWRLVQTSTTGLYIASGNHTGESANELRITFGADFGTNCTVCRSDIFEHEITEGVSILAGAYTLPKGIGTNSRLIIVDGQLTTKQRAAITNYLAQHTVQVAENSVANGAFVGGSTTDWTVNGWTVSPGYASLAAINSGIYQVLVNNVAISVSGQDKIHVLEFDYASSEKLDASIGQASVIVSAPAGGTFESPLRYSAAVCAGAATVKLRINNDETGLGVEYLSNITIREVI